MVRVMDVEYGADADSDDWLVREAGSALQRDKENQEFDAEDMCDKIYRTGVCYRWATSPGRSSGK